MAKAGWVYIVSHPRIRRAVKIGGTARPPQARVAELNGAAVPGRLRTHHYVRTADWRALERALHRRLARHRIPNSEWFAVSPRHARRDLNAVRLHEAPARLLTLRQWLARTLAAPVVVPLLMAVRLIKWTALTSLMLALISGISALMP